MGVIVSTNAHDGISAQVRHPQLPSADGPQIIVQK